MTSEERAEVVGYRMQRAIETLQEVPVHLRNGLNHTALNRLYYACFYAVLALLTKNQIITKTRAGARQMFHLHFSKTGKLASEHAKSFSYLFDMRNSGDYNDFIKPKTKDIEEWIPRAKALISDIEKIN